MWIAYTRPDGGVTIHNVASRENLSSVLGKYVPVERERPSVVKRRVKRLLRPDKIVVEEVTITETVDVWQPPTVEEYVDHVFARCVPADAVDVTVLPPGFTVPDRADREFWRLRNGQIVVEKP